MTEQQMIRLFRQVVQEELSGIKRNMVPETMTQEQVSKALGVEVSTLAFWRSTGKGPMFIKSGTKVMYLAADINDYIERNRMKP